MASSPWQWPVPRPLQQLFDHFPLLTYGVTELPARSRPATSDGLPTLYVFVSEVDARIGAPSFNPGCLKWQTFLRLAGVSFRILPSTNHASPTGALPFLLPARPQTAPIPSSKLQAYALEHGTSPIQQQQQQQPPPLRQDAYQALLDLPLRNAWLHALYLDPAYTPLLDDFYTTPASSSTFVRDTLRRRLRRAAEAEILKTGSYISSAAAGTAVVDEARVLDAAREALGGLASLLAESETGWFFDAPTPGLFDASVFAYTYLMVRYMSDGTDSGSSSRGKTHDDKAASSWSGLGDLVKSAGDGELAGHVRRVMEAVGWDGI